MKLLTPDAQADRDDFESSNHECTCHLSPPCGWCTHPGNPHNQERDECWMESPNSFHFDSQIRLGERLGGATEVEIKQEPMLYRCDLTHAARLGGDLTDRFLDALPDDWLSSPLVIDSRTHMLMRDWYPCIPGWHHDDVPREREDGQPDYVNPSYKAEHVMALFGDASLTEFAIGQHDLPDVPMGRVFYGDWHPMVSAHVEQGVLKSVIAPQAQLIFFDWQTWHQGRPATKDGWRFFIRATRFTKIKPANERRTQAQVYMAAPMAGW